MIRELIEPDIDEVQQCIEAAYGDEIHHASKAWTRIQMRLYRYSGLLQHLEDTDHKILLIHNYLAQEKTDLAINRERI